jgi:hypothetical protein
VHPFHQSAGEMPRFAIFTPTVRSWKHGAYGEHVRRTQWRAQVDYYNLLTVTESYQEQTP